MFAGTAKPIPTLPPDASPLAVAICELIPMTRPLASSSGPPELPGLSAASVWITLSIAKPLGAVSRRWSAETTPVVSVRSSPNGLPIATVGSPTRTEPESPRSSGVSSRSSPSTSTRSSARSVSASFPTSVAATVWWSENVTRISVAASTTCAFVRIRPSSSSITKPEPVDSAVCWLSNTSNGDGLVLIVWARMNTTPGAVRS